jgi:hypothetical protein
VIGGWAFGALWVLSMVWLTDRARIPARQQESDE